MSKVLFIQKRQLMQQEYIGIMQISAVLKKHHHTCDLLIMENDRHILHSTLEQYQPDLIAFSVMTIDSRFVLDTADWIKKQGFKIPIIAGGPHPTYFPDFIQNKAIDLINIGEGEYSMLELMDALEKGTDYHKIKNLYVKQQDKIYKNPLRPLVDLADLPIPDREIYLQYDLFQQQKVYNFTVSRGCFFDCSFCFIHQWNELYQAEKREKKISFKSIARIIQEIKEFSQKASIELVSFADSTFNLDKKWTIRFFKEYAQQLSLPFTLNLRANLVDEDVIQSIAGTGLCHSVRLGVEVGSEKLRFQVLRKKITNAQFFETNRLLKKYHLKMIAYTMYGLPGETLEDAFATISMLQKLKPYSFSSQIFHPYPCLAITKQAIQNGYLNEKDIEKLAESNFKLFNSILNQKEIQQVINLYQLSIPAIKMPFLFPLIKKMVHWKKVKLFQWIYLISSYFNLKKYTIIKFFQKKTSLKKNTALQ